jgi:multiple sugar transport system ATP-binding protein
VHDQFMLENAVQILREPKVFLFDEPLSNLDAALRNQMRFELARLHRTLGERIAVFNAGRIEQVGPPMALYERPATRFVAGFLGSPSMNFLAARIVPNGAGGSVEANGTRRIVQDGGLPAQVELVELLGDSGVAHLRLDGSDDIVTFKTHDGAGAELATGARVQLLPDFARALWFGADGRTLDVR